MQPRLVLIDWADAQTETGWREADDVKDDRTNLVRSVGWILEKTPEFIRLAADIGTTDGQTNRRLKIPRSWIIKLRNIH